MRGKNIQLGSTDAIVYIRIVWQADNLSSGAGGLTKSYECSSLLGFWPGQSPPSVSMFSDPESGTLHLYHHLCSRALCFSHLPPRATPDMAPQGGHRATWHLFGPESSWKGPALTSGFGSLPGKPWFFVLSFWREQEELLVCLACTRAAWRGLFYSARKRYLESAY